MPKSVAIRVSSMDAELEFSIAPTTTGRQLFDQVAKTLGLREVWYFGLQTLDSENRRIWLKYSKKVLPQVTKYQGKILRNGQNSTKKPHVLFIVKFFPEDVEKELIQEITLRLFYLQVKENIVEGEIFCNPEIAVLLASYAAQVKFGDYDNDKDYTQFMKTDQWLPGRIVVDNRMTLNQWQERILEWYAEHRGMLKEDAMMEYLKIAQELEMYGVNYFEVSNKKQTPLILGVDALGLNVYDSNNRLTPRLGFPWNEIRHLHSHNKKFLIKSVDKKTHDFILYSPSQRMNKQILLLAAGNHQLYKRRRDSEPIEVLQMRISAKAEKDAKLEERRALFMERMQRMEAERNRAELEDKLQKYQSQYHLAIQELEKSKSNLHLNHSTEDETDGEITKTEKKCVQLLETNDDFSDESKSLREKIARMKEEIEERRQILKLILENDTNSMRKRDSVKSLLKVYSSILPSGDEIVKDSTDEDEYKLIRERIEALSAELSDVRQKTQEVRRDLLNARRQHSTSDILDKRHLLKYFSEVKQEADI